MPAYNRTGDRLSQTTRYLCTAAFLVPGFADSVVRELIGEQRRCVPPSHGFDLDPVVRQCFRARRLNLCRQLVATVLLLVAAYLSWPLVLLAIFLGVAVRVFRSAALSAFLRRFRLGRFARWVVWYLSLSVIFGLGLLAVTALASAASLLSSVVSSGPEYSSSASAQSNSGLALVALAVLFAALFLFRRAEYRVVTHEFAADVPHRRRKFRDSMIEDRLAVIASSQRGNVIVHHDDPFLGCGRVQQGWSISLTLRPRTPAGGAPGQEPVKIDPVALNERLKQAIGSMRAPWLVEGQRVSGISVRSYVVADGVRAEDDPLIDPEVRMPYTMADEATVDAIVANPQGGLRQYLRVVIPVRGKAIHDGSGRAILDAQALGISVSAFVHVAVEGGMLYAEFLGTVLPPLRPECRLADALRPDKITSYAFGVSLRTAVVDLVAGPKRLAVGLARVVALRWAMHRSTQRAREFRTHDYGARVSVRDLASDESVQSYLEKLDGIKYVKLVDRIVGEAIIDFLVEAGVDPLEFRQAVSQITLQNSSLVQVGAIQGGQNNFGGDANVFTTISGGPVA